jgi:hypothetical protein
MIVSKSSCFRERSYVEGFSPKIIWLDVGRQRVSIDRRLSCSPIDRSDGQRSVVDFIGGGTTSAWQLKNGRAEPSDLQPPYNGAGL